MGCAYVQLTTYIPFSIYVETVQQEVYVGHHTVDQCSDRGRSYRPAVDKAVVQELAGVVEPVPDVAQHHPEGLRHWDGVPEVCIVLALALLCQHVGVVSLLGGNLLCQSLHASSPNLLCLCYLALRKKHAASCCLA